MKFEAGKWVRLLEQCSESMGHGNIVIEEEQDLFYST